MADPHPSEQFRSLGKIYQLVSEFLAPIIVGLVVDWLAAAGQSWWQVLPLGPPDEFDSPYKAASAFAGWRGLLEDPDAPVEVDELDAFVARHPTWIGEWAAFAGEHAVADQVRFEREWGALKAYANERGIGLIGDLPIYVAENGADRAVDPLVVTAHQDLEERCVTGYDEPDDFLVRHLVAECCGEWLSHRVQYLTPLDSPSAKR
jgi:hypothetical protein